MKKCSICGKNTAMIMITKLDESGKRITEGICMECATKMGMSPLDEMLSQINMSEEDINNISNQLMNYMNEADIDDMSENSLFNMMTGAMNDFDEDEDEAEESVLKSEKIIPFSSKEKKEAKEDSKEENDEKESIESSEQKEINEARSMFQDFINSFGKNNKSAGTKTQDASRGKKKFKHLDKYGENLNEKALSGGIDKVVGRDIEIERVIQILNRRNKNNPVLIGEPGVGKTAIAEGLALKIVNKEVPIKISRLQIYLLDLTAIVAGTQFRGQFESRMNAIIKEAKKAGDVVLVIDEVHNIVGAGEVTGGIMNAGNILKPALAKGDIQIIGATTLEEYRKHIGKEDIESSIIRCVGNPEERLKEDPLRKLRAVRFAAQKNLSLDPRLMDAIKKSPDLSVVSPERIRVEMDKILISENPSKGIDLMLKIGLLEEIIPELIPSVGFDQMSKHHEFSVYKHILSVVSKLPPDKNLRWAGLFHDIAKPICFFIGDDGHGHFTGHEEEGAEIADSIMRRLKFSNEDRTKIRNIVYLHGRYPVLKKRPVRKWMAKLISKYSMNPIELVSFFEADYGGKRTEPLKTNYFDKLKKLMDEIKSEENVFSRGDLKVSGKDLISDLNLREEEYRNLGFIFDQLLDACISQPELNEKQILIDMARDILKNKI